jgi:hypothetical protein
MSRSDRARRPHSALSSSFQACATLSLPYFEDSSGHLVMTMNMESEIWNMESEIWNLESE